MPQPPAYSRSSNLTEYATASPAAPYPPALVDGEFNNLVATLSQALSNLALIQRDDGVLRNQSVGPETLNSAALALIGSAGFSVANPVGWLTARAYPARQIVTQGGGTYVSVMAHTSGTFSTDLAAGRWVLLYSSAAVSAASVAFTPTGTVAATNTQAAIAEVAGEAMQKSANLGDVADRQAALNTLTQGAARRLLADLSNPTLAERFLVQTTALNGNTMLGLLPNGTSQQSGLCLESDSALPANASLGVFRIDATATTLSSSTRGGGSARPLHLEVGAAPSGRLAILDGGSATLGSGLPAAGARNFTVVNADAGAGSSAQIGATSNAGSVSMQAPSTAAGGVARITSSASGGMSVTTSNAASLSFGVNNSPFFTLQNGGEFSANGMPAYFCRAWVNFNGQGAVTARGSRNISSIGDLGIGCYEVNFLTPMPDANYAPHVSASLIGGGSSFITLNSDPLASARVPPTTSKFTLLLVANGSIYDSEDVSVVVFR